jgi:hypothetical protein
VQMRDLHVEHNLLTSFAGLGDQPHLKHIFLQGNEVSECHRSTVATSSRGYTTAVSTLCG